MDRIFLSLIAADESMQRYASTPLSLSYMVRGASVIDSTPAAATEDDASVCFSHWRSPKEPTCLKEAGETD